jgi:hypothetical protein
MAGIETRSITAQSTDVVNLPHLFGNTDKMHNRSQQPTFRTYTERGLWYFSEFAVPNSFTNWQI